MDHLEQFKQYAALVQQMRDADQKYIAAQLSDLPLSKLTELAMEVDELSYQVDTFPLPWEKGGGKKQNFSLSPLDPDERLPWPY